MSKNRSIFIAEALVYLAALVYGFLCSAGVMTSSNTITCCLCAASAVLLVAEKPWSSRNRILLIILSAVLFILSGFDLQVFLTLLLVTLLKGEEIRKLVTVDTVIRLIMIIYCLVRVPQADISFHYLALALELLYILDGAYEIGAFAVLTAAGVLLKFYNAIPLLVFYELVYQVGSKNGLLDNIGLMMVSEQLFPIVYLLAWLIKGEHSMLFNSVNHYGMLAGILGVAAVAFVVRWDYSLLQKTGNKKLAVLLFAVILAGLFSDVFLSVTGCLLLSAFGTYFNSDHDFVSELADYEKNNRQISIDEQKAMQLDMMKDIKRVCEANDIVCFLGGGTLLGAVRHRGYIPWDDDIDIMLPRKDYERFAEIYNSQCDPDYKYLDFRHTYGYYYPFGKVVDQRTKMFEFKYKNVDEMGIYIDVFPIDNMPDDDASISRMFKTYAWLRKPIFLYQRNDVNKLKRRNRIIEKIRVVIAYIIGYFNVYYFSLLIMDKAIRKYENSDTSHVACLTGVYKEKELMPNDYMKETVMVQFEDEEYGAPVGYADYLTKHYGDYMQLPPEENRVAKHENKSFWRQI